MKKILGIIVLGLLYFNNSIAEEYPNSWKMDINCKQGNNTWYESFFVVSVKNNKGYGHGILAGLKVAKGEIIGWTHADLQTDPIDVLKGLDLFHNSPNPEFLFIKGILEVLYPLLAKYMAVGVLLVLLTPNNIISDLVISLTRFPSSWLIVN